MDITRLGFTDNAFDTIICSHVLEHVPKDVAAARELLRVLKPGGTCIIQVPIEPDALETKEYGAPNAEEFDHVRAYGRDFGARLASAGFEVTFAEVAEAGGMFEATKSSGTGVGPPADGPE